jgi:NAD(P)-dependent dehydrogenase (short-subunit alcohol dehydrogenase family)
MTGLNSQVVFITGAAGGIGAELARRLHAEGAKLVLTDLDETRLAEVAGGLGHERVLTIVADVRDCAAMQSAADQAVERFGGIDTVVANAGITTYGSIRMVDPDAFRRLIDVNVIGVYHTVRATLPTVIRRRGYMLVVSSVGAYAACPGLAPYSASKAAVEMFANALRIEVAHLGVDVGSAHMSWIDTPLVHDTKSDVSTFTELLARVPYPLGRTSSVDKCGKAFVSGIKDRKRRINSPSWVALMRWLKPLLSTQLGDRQIRGVAAELMPKMDAEVAALGRSVSAHTDELEKR